MTRILHFGNEDIEISGFDGSNSNYELWTLQHDTNETYIAYFNNKEDLIYYFDMTKNQF